MMDNTKEIIGISAGVLSFIGYAIYIYSTLQGSTKPNRATWWILTLVGIMIATSYYSEGARNTIWVPVSYVIGPLIVAILSLRYGEGGWEKLDVWCLAAAGLSAVIWYLYQAPFTVLVVNIVMDFVALLPTIKKSYLRPDSEDALAWSVESVSGILNVIALESWTLGLAFYPLYLLMINALVSLLLLWGKIRKISAKIFPA